MIDELGRHYYSDVRILFAETAGSETFNQGSTRIPVFGVLIRGTCTASLRESPEARLPLMYMMPKLVKTLECRLIPCVLSGLRA